MIVRNSRTSSSSKNELYRLLDSSRLDVHGLREIAKLVSVLEDFERPAEVLEKLYRLEVLEENITKNIEQKSELLHQTYDELILFLYRESERARKDSDHLKQLTKLLENILIARALSFQSDKEDKHHILSELRRLEKITKAQPTLNKYIIKSIDRIENLQTTELTNSTEQHSQALTNSEYNASSKHSNESFGENYNHSNQSVASVSRLISDSDTPFTTKTAKKRAGYSSPLIHEEGDNNETGIVRSLLREFSDSPVEHSQASVTNCRRLATVCIELKQKQYARCRRDVLVDKLFLDVESYLYERINSTFDRFCYGVQGQLILKQRLKLIQQLKDEISSLTLQYHYEKRNAIADNSENSGGHHSEFETQRLSKPDIIEKINSLRLNEKITQPRKWCSFWGNSRNTTSEKLDQLMIKAQVTPAFSKKILLK